MEKTQQCATRRAEQIQLASCERRKEKKKITLQKKKSGRSSFLRCFSLSVITVSEEEGQFVSFLSVRTGARDRCGGGSETAECPPTRATGTLCVCASERAQPTGAALLCGAFSRKRVPASPPHLAPRYSSRIRNVQMKDFLPVTAISRPFPPQYYSRSAVRALNSPDSLMSAAARCYRHC